MFFYSFERKRNVIVADRPRFAALQSAQAAASCQKMEISFEGYKEEGRQV